MTRKKKYNYESNSFVAAAEQVYVFSLFLANSCRDSEISVLVRSVNYMYETLRSPNFQVHRHIKVMPVVTCLSSVRRPAVSVEVYESSRPGILILFRNNKGICKRAIIDTGSRRTFRTTRKTL